MLGQRLLARPSLRPLQQTRALSSSGRRRLAVKNEPRRWEEARLLGAQGLEVAHSSRTRPLFAQQLEAAALCDAEARPFRLLEARGCRLFSLRPDERGEARLSRSVALAIADRIKKYEGNSWAEIVIFASNMDQKGLLQGVDLEEWAAAADAKGDAGREYLQSLYGLQEVINQSNKTIVTWLEGENALGTMSLLKRQFLVGTDTTRVHAKELEEGYLPMFGAAQLLSTASYSSPAIASYLGLSGRKLDFGDLYALGVVTHLSSKEGLGLFVEALGETTTDVDPLVGFHQSQLINKHAVADQLEAVCLTTPEYVANYVYDEELQRQVEPVAIPEPVVADIDRDAEVIERCFSESTVEDVVEKLREAQEQHPLATQALQHMQRINPLLLKAWHHHCTASKKMSAKDVVAAEINANNALASAGLQAAAPFSETVDIDGLVKNLKGVSQRHVEKLFKK